MRPLTFTGESLRLCAIEPDEDAELFSRWSANSEFSRLLNSIPARPDSAKKIRSRLERDESDPDTIVFGLQTLTEDQLIGFVALDGIDWQQQNSFLGIGIGESELWGKGYGTEAMRLILRYAFDILGLERVTLDVFEYNERAYRSYLNVGFVEEGRLRQYLNRDGRRWDLIYMGILCEEWEASQG